jgi:hypothetical protein
MRKRRGPIWATVLTLTETSAGICVSTVSSVSVCGADLSDRARADPIGRRRGRHGLVALKVVVTRRPWSLTVLTVSSGVARILMILLPARPSRLGETGIAIVVRRICVWIVSIVGGWTETLSDTKPRGPLKLLAILASF